MLIHGSKFLICEGEFLALNAYYTKSETDSICTSEIFEGKHLKPVFKYKYTFCFTNDIIQETMIKRIIFA